MSENNNQNGNNMDDFFKDEQSRLAEQRQSREQQSQFNRPQYNPYQQPTQNPNRQGQWQGQPPQYPNQQGYRPQQYGQPQQWGGYNQTPQNYGNLPPNYGNMNYSGMNVNAAPRNRRKNALLISLAAVLMIAVFFLGMLVHDLALGGSRKMVSDVEKIIKDWSLFYDGDEEALYYNAANAMLQSVDPYAMLLTPSQNWSMQHPQSGEQEAVIGVAFSRPHGDYEIAEVVIGSPAYHAGVFAGDIVTGVRLIRNNSQWVTDEAVRITHRTTIEEFYTAIGRIQDTNGNWKSDSAITHMQLLLERNDAPVVPEYDGQFILEKQIFRSADVDYYFNAANHGYSIYNGGFGREFGAHLGMSQYHIKENKLSDLDATDIGYIRLTTFMDGEENNSPADQFGFAMERFKQAGKKRLILDLRNNGGGRVDICAAIAEYLIYEEDGDGNAINNLLVSKNIAPKVNLGVHAESRITTSRYATYFNPKAASPQIVILTNGGSASASESLTGAMLDYGTAVQVGTKTYGKGVAQTMFEFGSLYTIRDKDGNVLGTSKYAAYLTIYKFHSPKTNFSPEGIGFTPKGILDESDYKEQTMKAVEVLKGNIIP